MVRVTDSACLYPQVDDDVEVRSPASIVVTDDNKTAYHAMLHIANVRARCVAAEAVTHRGLLVGRSRMGPINSTWSVRVRMPPLACLPP